MAKRVLAASSANQLAPGVLSASSIDKSNTFNLVASFAAMTPLAVLAAFVDGPLIGFASEHTPDGGFAVGVIDRAIAYTAERCGTDEHHRFVTHAGPRSPRRCSHRRR